MYPVSYLWKCPTTHGYCLQGSFPIKSIINYQMHHKIMNPSSHVKQRIVIWNSASANSQGISIIIDLQKHNVLIVRESCNITCTVSFFFFHREKMFFDNDCL